MKKRKDLVVSKKRLTFATTRTRQASPLDLWQFVIARRMLKCAGRFIFYIMSNRIPFQKSYTNAHDLVSLLQSRGLTVKDTAKAESYLEYIGYYRLSAYMYPLLQMPKEQHRYKPNATFSQIMMIYRFDKKLRLLIFNEIEKIEVAITFRPTTI